MPVVGAGRTDQALQRGHSMSIIRATTESFAGNRLLAALPPAQRARLLPELESTAFSLGDVVYESGQRLQHIYFPTSCIASLVITTQSGVTAEVALVGNEGALGIALFLGGATMPNCAVVQIAGGALRMRANTLRAEVEHSGPFRRLLSRYPQALITQISQTAVCNRLHRVEQRLCRRILLCRDRLQSDELLMTHEFMANMLGGRRQSVTAAAGGRPDSLRTRSHQNPRPRGTREVGVRVLFVGQNRALDRFITAQSPRL